MNEPTPRAASRGSVDFDRAPLLVWQMGKVGSMSIHDALLAAGLPAVHVHVLNPRTLATRRRLRAEAGLGPTQQHLEADRLAPLLADPAVGFRAVSAVRDPIAQRLSAVFQLWNDFPPGAGVDKSDPAQVARWFIETCDHGQVLRWFEEEIEETFGVDVFDTPFDRASRALRVETSRLKLLVLRCEDDNASKADALNRFLGRTDISLGHVNSAAEKPEAGLYEQVKRTIAMPSALVDKYLSARFVRHFYDDAEIAAIRATWEKTDRRA